MNLEAPMRPRTTTRPMLIACVAVLASFAATVAPVRADVWQDPATLPPGEVCDIDHTGEDHSGQVGVGFTFDGVPFIGADLSSVDLKSALLGCLADDGGLSCDGDCADFTGATLDGAILSSADATGAGFQTSSMVDTILSGATLVEADFTTADLSGAILDGVDATDAEFGQVNLSRARGRTGPRPAVPDPPPPPTSFAGANLRNAILLQVDFRGDTYGAGTSFVGTDLRGTRTDCKYEDVVVDSGEVDENGFPILVTVTVASDCPDFTNADFAGADFRNAQWRGAKLGGANFAGATRLEGARFETVDLTGAGSDCQFDGATNTTRCQGAVIDGLDFGDVALLDAVFIAPHAADADTWVEASFEDAIFDDADISGAVLCDAPDFDELIGDTVDCAGALLAAPTACVDLKGELTPRSLRRTGLRQIVAPTLDLSGGDPVSDPAFDLRDSDLRFADLRCASLAGIDLRGTVLDGADFAGADFVGDSSYVAATTDLVGACFSRGTGDTRPQPECPRFDGAKLESQMFEASILDGATFVGAELMGADLSMLQSRCDLLLVDPDINEGVEDKRFCIDFTRAKLGPDADGELATFDGAIMDAPIFVSADADQVVLTNVIAQCVDGFLPAEIEDDPPIIAEFCASFEGATLTSADFTDSIFAGAKFGCLPHDGEDAPPFDACSDLRGANFDGLVASNSLWEGDIDLGEDDEGDEVVFSNARLGGATITCRAEVWSVAVDPAPPGEDEPEPNPLQVSYVCPDFANAKLTPDLELSFGSVLGVDWSNRDLSGASFLGTQFGCFEFDWTNRADEPQTLVGDCTKLRGATLVDADLSQAGLAGIDLSESDLSGANLSRAVLYEVDDEDNVLVARFASDYVPADDAEGDAIKDDCMTTGERTVLVGANLDGVDLTNIVDFGGECIEVNLSTRYSEDTLGLTEELKKQMSEIPVPEPGSSAAAWGALSTLAWLARRRRGR